MSKICRGELQDNLGNTIYPHTEAGLVFCADGETVQQKIAGTAETLDGITGVSDSTDLNDSTKLATSKAVKTLKDSVNNSLGGLSFAQDANGKWGYKVGADAVIPFKSGANIIDVIIHGPNQVQTYTFTADYDSVLVLTANCDDGGLHVPSVKISSGTVTIARSPAYKQNGSRVLNYAGYQLTNVHKGDVLTTLTNGYIGVAFVIG